MSDQSDLKKLGTRIRQFREQKDMSQQELASLCNFEKSNMSRIESGNTNPTFLTLKKISIALAISISELVAIE